MIAQFASDLHLEFPQNMNFLKTNPLQPVGEMLLLAGDIVPFAVMNKFDDFFNYISDNFKATYWIPGNHEYYYYDVSKKCGLLNEKIRDNVFLVNNTSVVLNNVEFIFSTLWSKIRPAYEWQIERGLNDFHVIKYKNFRFSTTQYNQFHDDSLDFINKELQKKKECPSIVVTHHVPTYNNYPDKFKGSVLNDAFTVELFDLIEKFKPDYWIYGHSHYNTPDFNIGETKMLTNQLGYVQYNEHLNFDSKKSINIKM